MISGIVRKMKAAELSFQEEMIQFEMSVELSATEPPELCHLVCEN